MPYRQENNWEILFRGYDEEVIALEYACFESESIPFQRLDPLPRLISFHPI